ncbi:tyrosyl-DNA phosphodiesterase 1 [Mortierella hygrophila]|uniref:Tyrosyl-DNA phosphodiesterase 1 n=1 Tax=Mortierella hygrophila TaxID=979708 RepID=A0A9P6F631_9FUNG|nr:tyrosyl-DNA phosphodiesterase 1 [Mortierella hygrophila]
MSNKEIDDEETSAPTPPSAPGPPPSTPPKTTLSTTPSAPSALSATASPLSSMQSKNNNNGLKRPLTGEGSPSSSPKKPKENVPIRYLESPICLTSVERAPSSLNVGCVTLKSLIGDPDLELMEQINFMIDVPFVMSHIHESIRDGLKTIVYHGLRLSMNEVMALNATIANAYPRVTMHSVPVAGMGTHHTKAMILFYRGGTMQLVIHTANMIERDWRNKTQGVFMTGRLSKKSETTGLSTCAFERDLLEYLDRYFEHEHFTSRVRQYDFSMIKAVLIASAPGKYKGPERNKWGHLKLRAVLRQQVEVPKELIPGSKIICQMSSIGSLGKDSQDWLKGEFEASLNSYRNSKTFGVAELCVVYPTAENVRTSFEGWSMGGSIPFRSITYEKQAHYLNPILHSWRGLKSGRERAMPHIKTFTRVTSRTDGDHLAWFLLTSANLSKPAWGEVKDGGVYDVKSYELGVLIFPGLFEDCGESGEILHVSMMNSTVLDPYPEPSTLTLDEFNTGTAGSSNNDESDGTLGDPEGLRDTIGVVPIRLPYDLPLRKYDFAGGDHVWLVDKQFPGQDNFGITLAP